MKRLIGFLAMLVLLVACGANWDGPELGDFPAITKAETDAPFQITAPSSRSPAAFTFTSSDPNVATIDGTTVTLHGVGSATITAAQPRDGAYGPTSKATTLTVTSTPCATGTARVNGTCTPAACVSPATLTNNQCIAPSSGATATSTTSGSLTLTWRGVTHTDTYANAVAFCATTYTEGFTGWRLPTPDELKALVASKAATGHGWTLDNAWSSTAGTTLKAASHITVNLDTGASLERLDTEQAYVSCVR
jgi:hypothetical protein